MKNLRFRNIHISVFFLFICLLHLPFAFAKTRSKFDFAAAPVQLAGEPADSTSSLRAPVENSIYSSVYDNLRLGSRGLAREVFDYALKGYNYMKETGKINNHNIISIVDFSKPSSQKRLFIIDLKNCRLLFNTYVAHGSNSGKAFATEFSNVPESNKSSLGFYSTAATYMGKHGYSLHLLGVEKGVNDNAYDRDIVVHGASYVNEDIIRSTGCIGRSWGCPAVPERLSRPIIEKIKNGTCLFIYGKDKNYFSHSKLLRPVQPLLAYNG